MTTLPPGIAQVIAPCPACTDEQGHPTGLADTPSNQMGATPSFKNGNHKTGRWKGFPRTSMPVCRFCKGKRHVYLAHICECGMPAVYYDKEHKVWYCGDLLCAQHADWRKHYDPTPSASEIEAWHQGLENYEHFTGGS